MDLKTFHLHTHSALHCGTGQSAGIVDLPIARDRATGLPLVPGSSLRGVLRKDISTASVDLAKHLFGPRDIAANTESFAGALSIGDANLLILPVRSLAGIVAYATCPFILKQYSRDIKRSSKQSLGIPTVDDNKALCANNNQNQMETNKLILEDLDIDVQEDSKTQAWANYIANQVSTDSKDDFTQRFIILSDNLFSYLSDTATEIRTRIRINEETGVVKQGALWTEENLPSGAILWGVYSVTDSMPSKNSNLEPLKKDALLDRINNNYLLQLGGNAGIGRGLASIFFDKTKEAKS